MIKLNCKGFMMAEVIIVSTVILSTLVGLYTIFNKMYIVYTERSYYYNIDAIYAGESIYNYLINNEKLTSLVKTINDSNSYYDIISIDTEQNNRICNEELISETLCNTLGNTYSIKRVILTKYNKDYIEKIENQDAKLTDYINYIKTNLNFNDTDDNNDKFSYIIITDLENDDNQYFGYYRIR